MLSDILWLGAHKTGATYLQDRLLQVRHILVQSGLSYVHMSAARVRCWISSFRHNANGAGSSIIAPLPRKAAPTAMRYWIFDKNILSLVQHTAQPQGLYLEGAERALKMGQVLRLSHSTSVLGLRNMVGYLPSLYCEILKSTPFRSFDAFLHDLNFENLS